MLSVAILQATGSWQLLGGLGCWRAGPRPPPTVPPEPTLPVVTTLFSVQLVPACGSVSDCSTCSLRLMGVSCGHRGACPPACLPSPAWVNYRSQKSCCVPREQAPRARPSPGQGLGASHHLLIHAVGRSAFLSTYRGRSQAELPGRPKELNWPRLLPAPSNNHGCHPMTPFHGDRPCDDALYIATPAFSQQPHFALGETEALRD